MTAARADRSGADDRDGVAGLDTAGQDADLVSRWEDVCQEHDLFVGQLWRKLVHGGIRERHSRILRLQAVDQVAEDPTAAAGAEAVAALLAEPAATAGRDARDKHAVAFGERGDCVAGLDDRSDGLVAEDAAWLDLRDIAFQDVQVGAADRRRVDSDDGVGGLLNHGVGHGFPGPLRGAW
jgi:hypothetical protein